MGGTDGWPLVAEVGVMVEAVMVVVRVDEVYLGL